MRTVENIPVDSQLLEDIHYINQEKPVAFYHAWLKPGEENKIPWHWHPVMQIGRLKEGEGRFFVGDMQFKLKEGDGIIALIHYPPFNVRRGNSLFTDNFEKNGVAKVVYGHLHGKECRTDLKIVKNGVEYYLTSCDPADNKLTFITE